MRKLTGYELTLLIKNEIQCMQMNSVSSFDLNYIRARIEDVKSYIEEYDELRKIE